MRTPVFAVLTAATLAITASAADDFPDLYKAATTAHAAKDYATEKARLRDALKIRPAHPAALYQLAAAQARSGETDAAFDTLETLAAMGLAYDPAADNDFDGLHASPRFTQVNTAFFRNREPAGDAPPVFRLVSPHYIPEGLAFDDDRKAYFIGGVHDRKIQRVGRSGQPEDFVNTSDLWAPLGMQVDSVRHLLWVTVAALPEMDNYKEEEHGKTAVVAFDLASGRQKQRFLLPDDKTPHQLNDLTVGDKGTLYVTDARGGILYALDGSTGKYTALTKPGELQSAQGVAVSADRKRLYVSDYTRGLFVYDLEQKTLSRLEVADRICVYGTDGLYRYENQLIAVQNGIRPNRVVRLTLDAAGRRVTHATVLAANLPDFDEPTLGVVVGSRFSFVANSQWNRFNDKHELPPSSDLRKPAVLRVSITD